MLRESSVPNPQLVVLNDHIVQDIVFLLGYTLVREVEVLGRSLKAFCQTGCVALIFERGELCEEILLLVEEQVLEFEEGRAFGGSNWGVGLGELLGGWLGGGLGS